MYLKHIPSGDLVEVIDLQDVISPYSPTVLARGFKEQWVQRAEKYLKSELAFPSGEALPSCWTQESFHRRIAI
jgi:hypothetical protein